MTHKIGPGAFLYSPCACRRRRHRRRPTSDVGIRVGQATGCGGWAPTPRSHAFLLRRAFAGPASTQEPGAAVLDRHGQCQSIGQRGLSAECDAWLHCMNDARARPSRRADNASRRLFFRWHVVFRRPPDGASRIAGRTGEHAGPVMAATFQLWPRRAMPLPAIVSDRVALVPSAHAHPFGVPRSPIYPTHRLAT